MKLVNVSDIEAAQRSDVIMKTLFKEKEGVVMGTVIIPPKTRVPMQGNGAHAGDEYSMILKGTVISSSGGKEYTLSTGQASLIPAGEEHWAYNPGEEQCEIIWFMVNK